MKIVFDTNVLISAFLTTAGPSQYILATALAEQIVILSPYILEEFTNKLVKKLAFSEEQAREMAGFLERRTVIIDAPLKNISFSDKKDIPILALLEASGAHYFVTGDKKLLDIKKWRTTFFLTVREALEILEEK